MSSVPSSPARAPLPSAKLTVTNLTNTRRATLPNVHSHIESPDSNSSSHSSGLMAHIAPDLGAGQTIAHTIGTSECFDIQMVLNDDLIKEFDDEEFTPSLRFDTPVASKKVIPPSSVITQPPQSSVDSRSSQPSGARNDLPDLSPSPLRGKTRPVGHPSQFISPATNPERSPKTPSTSRKRSFTTSKLARNKTSDPSGEKPTSSIGGTFRKAVSRFFRQKLTLSRSWDSPPADLQQQESLLTDREIHSEPELLRSEEEDVDARRGSFNAKDSAQAVSNGLRYPRKSSIKEIRLIINIWVWEYDEYAEYDKKYEVCYDSESDRKNKEEDSKWWKHPWKLVYIERHQPEPDSNLRTFSFHVVFERPSLWKTEFWVQHCPVCLFRNKAHLDGFFRLRDVRFSDSARSGNAAPEFVNSFERRWTSADFPSEGESRVVYLGRLERGVQPADCSYKLVEDRQLLSPAPNHPCDEVMTDNSKSRVAPSMFSLHIVRHPGRMNLPPEVWIYIFAFLRYPQDLALSPALADLTNCSYVCRRWNEWARPYVDSEKRELEGRADKGIKAISRHEASGRAIRELDLSCFEDEPHKLEPDQQTFVPRSHENLSDLWLEEGVEENPEDDYWHLVNTVLVSCPQLRSLVLPGGIPPLRHYYSKNGEWTPGYERFLSLRDALMRMRKLKSCVIASPYTNQWNEPDELYQGERWRFDQVIKLFARWPKLKSLTLLGLRSTELNLPTVIRKAFLKYTNSTVSGLWKRYKSQVLCEYPGVPATRLETLHLSGCSISMRELEHFLSESRLKELTIKRCPNISHQDLARIVASHSSTLEILVIRLFLQLRSDGTANVDPHWYPLVFLRDHLFNRSNYRQVMFDAEAEEHNLLDPSLLSLSSWNKLTHLYLLYCTNISSYAVAELIREKDTTFPSLQHLCFAIYYGDGCQGDEEFILQRTCRSRSVTLDFREGDDFTETCISQWDWWDSEPDCPELLPISPLPTPMSRDDAEVSGRPSPVLHSREHPKVSVRPQRIRSPTVSGPWKGAKKVEKTMLENQGPTVKLKGRAWWGKYKRVKSFVNLADSFAVTEVKDPHSWKPFTATLSSPHNRRLVTPSFNTILNPDFVQ